MSLRERSLALIVAATALIAPSLPAHAQTATPCARRAQMVDFLAKNFGERSIGRGVSSEGLLVEIFVGPSGSWSMILTNPAGVSCLVGSGDGWETPKPPDIAS